MMFPDYIIRKPLNTLFQGTNSKHVCNMDSYFRDNINLPNSHPSVLGHCYLFLVKNRVLKLLDQIAPKLPQKIRKNSRTITPLEGTSCGIPPLKIQNSIV